MRTPAIRPIVLAHALLLTSLAFPLDAQQRDPREGLRPGWKNAGEAISNMELLSNTPRPSGFFNPDDIGDFAVINSDLAFKGRYVFQGNFSGWQIFDISDLRKPVLVSSLFCPGGQGDVSIHGNLLFMSVEETRGRVDCGAGDVRDSVSRDRFRGVRIFDISDMRKPRQVAAVQTCRGSHTHTLVPDAKDKANIYVYVSGTAGVRSPNELAGCSGAEPDQDPNTSRFRIDVIRVPLAAPQNAAVVNSPRIFAAAGGKIAGLWPGGAHGAGTQTSDVTDQCHDITVYPELGLAAGACSGNGILLDISDVANPRRIDEVTDPNFAYWHSATFSNDGSKIVFTDEWGGGVAPRCRATDKPTWGANAVFTLENGKLHQRGYYKIPASQTETENCVAHNGSLIPVPGRDIMVQGWYQGGVSVFDFTDPSKPVEIAYFDRGPMDSTQLFLGGAWAAYWYNGNVYAPELGRGLDILALKPSAHLSQNEIDAARLVQFDVFNPQVQTRFAWPAHFSVSRAYVDQLERSGALSPERIARIRSDLDTAEKLSGSPRVTALERFMTALDRDAQGSTQSAMITRLIASLRSLAAAR